MTDTAAGHPKRWLILAVVLTAEIMDLLDSTVVNVAGPSLRRELGAGATALQWIIGGYPLALGAGLILGGRLGDRFGRRRLFLIGLAGFAIASLACGLAPATGWLIAFRLIQGGFGALLLPQGFGLIRMAFPPSEFGRAFAVFGPVFGIAGILGPLIGGGLIQANLWGTDWRLVFFVNVPLGIAALALSIPLLPSGGEDRAVRVDGLGALLVVVASALLVLPLIQGQEAGWPLWTWLCLAAAVVGYLLFVLQQRHRVNAGRTPLVVPTIFRKSHYDMGLVGIALFFGGTVGVQLTLTLFLQIGNGFTPGEAGLSTLPLAVGSGIGGALSGAVLADRLGRGALQIGGAAQFLGILLVELLLLPAGFSIWRIVPGLLISGFGQGMVVAALFNIVLAAVDDREVGSASGVLNAVQSIAASLGVAIFGSVFFGRVAHGDVLGGFRAALLIQLGVVAVFLLVSPLFPRRARADEHGEGATTVEGATA